jgi:XPG N-terminal domain
MSHQHLSHTMGVPGLWKVYLALLSASAACTDTHYPTDALSSLTNPVPNTGHSRRGFRTQPSGTVHDDHWSRRQVRFSFFFLLAWTDITLSIWMMKAQKVFHKPSHTQCGKNPELRALFYRLCYLARFQLSAVFIFDGAGRPSSKRAKQVRSKPHWLTEDFKKFISMFGFHYYMVYPSIFISFIYLVSCQSGTWRS